MSSIKSLSNLKFAKSVRQVRKKSMAGRIWRTGSLKWKSKRVIEDHESSDNEDDKSDGDWISRGWQSKRVISQEKCLKGTSRGVACPGPSVGATGRHLSECELWWIIHERTKERRPSRLGLLTGICPAMNYAQLSAVRRPLPRQRWWQRQGWQRMTSWASVSQEMRIGTLDKLMSHWRQAKNCSRDWL